MTKASLAVYGTWFALIVSINDYEGEFYPEKLPAYVEAVRKDDPAPRMEAEEGSARHTPREIYAYLDCKVWKQTEAKRAASVIMYSCLHGTRSNALFIGPSGCGKTHIWRCLQQIYCTLYSVTSNLSTRLDIYTIPIITEPAQSHQLDGLHHINSALRTTSAPAQNRR